MTKVLRKIKKKDTYNMLGLYGSLFKLFLYIERGQSLDKIVSFKSSF